MHVLVTRNDSTLLTRALKWVLSTTLAVCFTVLSTTVDQFRHLPAHTQLMPRRTGSEPTAQVSLPKTSGLQIHKTWTRWITTYEGNAGGLSQAPSEAENDHQTEVGQPTPGTNRQSHQRVFNMTEDLCCSWRSTTVNLSSLCYFCLNDVILRCDCLAIFKRVKVVRRQYCSNNNFRLITLANYMMIRLLCAHEIIKHL